MDIEELLDTLDEMVNLLNNDSSISIGAWLSFANSATEIKKILEKQITDRWISVTDKLPEKYGTYLVAWRPSLLNTDDIKRNTGKNLSHYYEMLEFDPDDESGWVSSIEQCEEYVLLAWRELPEPYVD